MGIWGGYSMWKIGYMEYGYGEGNPVNFWG